MITAERYRHTVSAVAGAIWTRVDLEPVADVRRWAMRTREVLDGLIADPASGVHRLTLIEFEREDPGPTWWETTPYVERIADDEVPSGYDAGFRIDGTITVPDVHLAWLEQELRRLGGSIVERRLDRLDDAPGDVVVNCTGLGSVTLAGDRSMTAIRGQVVHVRNPEVVVGLTDEEDDVEVTYLYPRPDGVVVLGGCRVPDDGPCRGGSAADPAEDQDLTRRVLADVAVLEPKLRGAVVERVRIGWRPGRPQVRVEAERLDDGRVVVHDYGHGGCGYLLSWGCAEAVARLVAAIDVV